MTLINFTVPGAPIPKGRARSVLTRRGKTIHYTPQKTKDYELYVRMFAQAAMRNSAIMDICPVYLNIEFHMPIPKSFSKEKRRLALKKQVLPISKPDTSNLVKSVEDAMNGVVYKDDSQIVRTMILKVYSDEPRAEITVQDYVYIN